MTGLNSEALLWLVFALILAAYGTLLLWARKYCRNEEMLGRIDPYLLPREPGELPKDEERKKIEIVFLTAAASGLATTLFFYLYPSIRFSPRPLSLGAAFPIRIVMLSAALGWLSVVYLLKRHSQLTGKSYPRFISRVAHRSKEPDLFQNGQIVYKLLFTLFVVMSIMSMICEI